MNAVYKSFKKDWPLKKKNEWERIEKTRAAYKKRWDAKREARRILNFAIEGLEVA